MKTLLFLTAFLAWFASLWFMPGGNAALLVVTLVTAVPAVMDAVRPEQARRRDRGETPYDWRVR